MAKFSERLRQLRNEHGFSQQEFSKQLGGVSKSSINMYERGEREPGLEMLEAIADFFNVDMDYLLGKSEIRNRSAVQVSASSSADDELAEYLELLRSRPECRMLFSLAKDATKSDVEKAVAIIEALRKTEGKS